MARRTTSSDYGPTNDGDNYRDNNDVRGRFVDHDDDYDGGRFVDRYDYDDDEKTNVADERRYYIRTQ
jgi:hypothetical protein